MPHYPEKASTGRENEERPVRRNSKEKKNTVYLSFCQARKKIGQQLSSLDEVLGVICGAVSSPSLETVTGEIDDDRRPHQQDQGEPEVLVGGVGETALQDVAQYHHHQPDINHQADTGQGEQDRWLSQVGDKQQDCYEDEGEKNCRQAKTFFKKRHGGRGM
jgi:hypothetical protein